MERAVPGDEFYVSADTWNRFVEAAEKSRNQSDVGAGFKRNKNQNGKILVHNNTGADIETRFPVIGLDGLAVGNSENATEFFRRQTYNGVEPTEDLQFAICTRPVKDGEVVEAYLFGASIVWLDDLDSSHEFATVASTSPTDQLESAESGPARILYRDGTAVQGKWAVVLFGFGFGGEGGSAEIKLVQATTNGNNGSVSVKDIELKSDLTLSPNFEQTGDAYTVAYLNL